MPHFFIISHHKLVLVADRGRYVSVLRAMGRWTIYELVDVAEDGLTVEVMLVNTENAKDVMRLKFEQPERPHR